MVPNDPANLLMGFTNIPLLPKKANFQDHNPIWEVNLHSETALLTTGLAFDDAPKSHIQDM